MLKSRVPGALFGALAGDCLGALFEEGVVVHQPNFTDQVSSEAFNARVIKFITGFPDSDRVLQYTDDTSMARSICQSFIRCDGFNVEDLAKTFCSAYDIDKSNPWRSYGNTVPSVFKQLQKTQFSQIFEPARHVFDGAGSMGNGAGMRVVPVPLFYANSTITAACEVAREQSLITHAHPDGVMGGVFQAAAVHIALNTPSTSLNDNTFVAEMKKNLMEFEGEIYQKSSHSITNPYIEALEKIELLLSEQTSTFIVAKVLGNSVRALESVPSALFSFLWCTRDRRDQFDVIENRLIRTIAYAISLGGDTDTIGTMAGAIAGAYYGRDYIPSSWPSFLEGFKDYEDYATSMLKLIEA